MVWRLRASLIPLPLLALLALPALAQDAGPADGGPVDGGGPEGWTCDAEYYGSDDGCDCGCGLPDPDCGGDASLEICRDGYEWCPVGEVPVDGSNHLCQANVCGDAWVEGDEACDDGDAEAGDGCAADCLTVEEGYICPFGGGACTRVVCGDGVVHSGEECDDGDAEAGDGCSDTCTLEEGWACPEPGGPCVEVPEAWACDPEYYGADDGCDCGCGVMDLDCPEDATIDDCFFGGICPDGYANPEDITECIPEPDAGPVPADDAGPVPGDDAGGDPMPGDDADGGNTTQGDDAGPTPGSNADSEPAGDAGDGDGGSSGCSASAVTTGAPLSLAVLALLGGLLVRRRRD